MKKIAPLKPQEIFSEVLNPMDENVKMRNETLMATGRKERISETYRTNQWVRWAYPYLYDAYLLAQKLKCNFICWPSPQSVKNSLNQRKQQWLLTWLPQETLALSKII